MKKFVVAVVLASAIAALAVEPPDYDSPREHWIDWAVALEDSALALNHDLLNCRAEFKKVNFSLVECRDEVWRLKWDQTKPAEHKPWWKRASTYRLLLVGIAAGWAVSR